MSIIVWSDGFLTRIPEIDAQHQQMIAKLNRCDEALQAGENLDWVCELFTQFVDHAIFHYETEEKHLSRFDYFEAEGHKRLHRAFVMKVSRFNSDLLAQRVQLSGDTMQGFADWTRDHLRVDQKWARLAR